MKKVALVTGCSTGLGLSISVELAKIGYIVYATMRNIEKASALHEAAKEANVKVKVLPLDVCHNESILDCVAQIISEQGQIDLLINNAGGGFAKTTEQATLEEIEWVTDLNYHGVVRCTKAVIPHMKTAQQGHIINITSVGGLVGQPFNEFYCAAKFAVEGYTEALASYMTTSFGIKFSLVEPGGIATEFMKNATEKTLEEGNFIQDEYFPILQKYLARSQQRQQESTIPAYQTADEVAGVVIKVIKSEIPPLRVRSSQWAEELCELKTQADPHGLRLLSKVKKDFLNDE